MSSYKVFREPDSVETSMIVCWDIDAGKIGPYVFDYLYKSLHLDLLVEIDPGSFFTFGGVLVEDDIVRFPQIRLYQCKNTDIVILYSAIPRFEWHIYLSTLFEVATGIARVKEIYTIGGMVSVFAHTAPRTLVASMNSAEVKSALSGLDIMFNLDYETPVGQRPTMSSYLLWEALQRNITGISIWAPVPFYLASVGDLKSCKKIVNFLNEKFALNINLSGMNRAVEQQNSKLNTIIDQHPDLGDAIRKLEENLVLSDTESSRLVDIVEGHLKGTSYY